MVCVGLLLTMRAQLAPVVGSGVVVPPPPPPPPPPPARAVPGTVRIIAAAATAAHFVLLDTIFLRRGGGTGTRSAQRVRAREGTLVLGPMGAAGLERATSAL